MFGMMGNFEKLGESPFFVFTVNFTHYINRSGYEYTLNIKHEPDSDGPPTQNTVT